MRTKKLLILISIIALLATFAALGIISHADNESQTYTITWINANGEELEVDENVPYGTVPTYDGEEPTMEHNPQYTYFFAGWDKEISEVTGYVTYTAIYDSIVNEYTVTWVNYDGSELQVDENVEYGTSPYYNGLAPERESDKQYRYSFSGWDKEIDIVEGDVTYTATYDSIVNEYKVRWLGEGDELLAVYDVPYGTSPTYTGPEPTKEGNKEFSYVFLGWTNGVTVWDGDIDPITGDTIYSVVFESVVNEYTVTWIGDGGEELEVDEYVGYGTIPTYDGVTPEKSPTALYTYTFTGWDKDIDIVEGDVTYTATFKQKDREYTVTWQNPDGTTLKTDSVAYGKVPAYTGDTPTQNATAQFTYIFAGWDETPSAVTKDVTYTATYDSTINKYTVTWTNFDGSVLEVDTEVVYGTTPTYDGLSPTKTATAQYTYSFAGWDKTPGAVEGDVTYTATYSSTVNKYTVTWKNADGSVLKTNAVEYGTTPTYDGTAPTKAATAQYTYTFDKWDKSVVSVTGDVTYTATFSSTVNKYTVTWKNADGTILETDIVEYGTTPTYDGSTPTKVATVQNTYTFKGWSPAITSLTGDITYFATYTATEVFYTVTWKNYDGTVLETDTGLRFGETPVFDGKLPAKASDETYDYVFAGWTPTLGTVKGSTVYTAKFKAREKVVETSEVTETSEITETSEVTETSEKVTTEETSETETTEKVTTEVTTETVTTEKVTTEETTAEETTNVTETEPVILDADSVWDPNAENADDGLTFISSANYKDFVEVRINGRKLDGKFYVVREGSTIVVIGRAYLETLPNGTYTIEIVSKTGTAKTTFIVVNSNVPAENNTASALEIVMIIVVIVLAVVVVVMVVVLVIKKKKR
ncbi:MAG: hypothetical protein K6F14_07255 [Clostridiales bacterium]|nr:hypothetical protein [Clostridiales bacterium]